MSTGYKNTSKTAASRLILAIVASTLLLSTATPAAAAVNALLNTDQVGNTDLSPFTKWTALMPRYERQKAEAESKCIGEGCKNQKWEALLTELADKPVQEQIDRVNKFFNTMKYVSDQQNYGIADYWNTPYELMERGGDCEDYAIAKYISLKRLGVSESDMRILIVRDQNLGGELHAILEVKTGDVAQILDNQAKIALPVAKVTHYSPIYAINENKWWAYK